MTAASHVELITEAQSLAKHLAGYWKRRAPTEQDCVAILRSFRRWGLDTLLDAIDQWRESNLDAAGPSWSEIRALLKFKGARGVRKGDGADSERAWLNTHRSNYADWMAELQRLDVEGDEVANDLRNWVWARLKYLDFWFYVYRPARLKAELASAAEHELPGAEALALRDRVARMATSADAARRMIEDAHFMVRNLRVLGGATNNARQRWLETLESEARGRGIILEHADPREGAPF